MSQDISYILEDWTFDPEANVRRVVGEDGAEKIQVRVDQGAFQGILQLALDGRPDGRRPHGRAFALDHYRALCDEARAGSGTFGLDEAACQELFDESSRVYGRYVFLLQLREFDRVIRDTERNMALFRFVNEHAERDEDRLNLERWWPYILRIHGVARAMKAAADDDYESALQAVAEARRSIVGLTEVEAEEFFVERERSQQALDELEEELRGKKPLSRRELLQQQLEEAVEREEFERAAALRDELKQLGAGESPSAEES